MVSSLNDGFDPNGAKQPAEQLLALLSKHQISFCMSEKSVIENRLKAEFQDKQTM
jgi:hypothetical protein